MPAEMAEIVQKTELERVFEGKSFVIEVGQQPHGSVIGQAAFLVPTVENDPIGYATTIAQCALWVLIRNCGVHNWQAAYSSANLHHYESLEAFYTREEDSVWGLLAVGIEGNYVRVIVFNNGGIAPAGFDSVVECLKGVAMHFELTPIS